MTDWAHHKALMIAALVLGALIVTWSLERRNRSARSPINLDDLLLGDDGKASKAAIVMHGSFLITSWVVIYQTLNDKLSDATFGLYVGAWVLPTVTKLIKGATPGVSSDTTIVQRTTVQVDPKEPS